MDRTRRHVLSAGSSAALLALLSAAGFVLPDAAISAGWNKAAFEGKTIDEALGALGAVNPAESTDIVMKVPDTAEDGELVPVRIESKIPGTESIALLIEKNAGPLVASFDIPAGTEPIVAIRVKMAETSNLYALVRADGKYFVTRKEVKVIQGACGCGA